MKAMILAAGLGTRLRPLTDKIPKVMVPVAGKPLLEHHLSWLKRYGITDIVINLHYLPDAVRNHFGDGSKFGVKIKYSYENQLLGTAGAVKKLENFFDDTFLVVYGDDLIDIDLEDLILFHRRQGGLATIAVYHHPETWTQGIVEIDNNYRIKSFIEKPEKGAVSSDLANTGIYVLEPAVLTFIPPNTFSDFGHDVFPQMLARGVSLSAREIKGYVQDIGTPERYAKAQEDVKMGRVWK